MNDGLLSGVGDRFLIQAVETTQRVCPPLWAQYMSFIVAGAGGGGGGGRRDTSATNAGGGAGGGGGGVRFVRRFPIFALPRGHIDCTIGAGGVAGAGASTSGFNGSSGGTGGNTFIYFWTRQDSSNGIYGNIIGIGGASGGPAGTTTNSSGQLGSTSFDFHPGGISASGGGSSAGFVTQPTNSGISYGMDGGNGGSAKNSDSRGIPNTSFYKLGRQITSINQTVGFGVDGGSSDQLFRATVERFLSMLREPPTSIDDLWWLSYAGGQGGTGGSTSTTPYSGGKGGNGWRGTGGGGGGGSGNTSGGSGGDGGTGGNACIYFFWQER